MATETERKFRIEPGVPVPVTAAGLSRGSKRRMRLTAGYFDTPDLLLARSGITLRRRTGGTDAGWHLKLPLEGDSREEVHAPLGYGAGEASVPGVLREKVADVIGYAPLLPIGELRTDRTESELVDEAGTVLAVLCDDTVTARRDGQEQTWRELEVELVDGSQADLDRVAAALAEAGIEPSASTSKLVQALGDRLQEAERPRKGRKASAAEVLQWYIQAQVGVIQGREAEVRVDAPDAVHKMRVASRRLRSILRTYRSLFDPAVVDTLREDLKWLGEILGGPRDAEVLSARLQDAVAELPEEMIVGPLGDRIRTELHERHSRVHAELVEALDGRRYKELSDALVTLANEPPVVEYAAARAKGVLPPLLEKAAKRAIKRWKAAEEATGEERLILWHETRKRAKAARYAWEAAVPVFGDEATAAAAAWEQVTESLGIVQDSIVARARLLELAEAAHAAGESSFSYGVLYERELARTDGAHAAAVAAMKNARKTGQP